jgi:protein gp37
MAQVLAEPTFEILRNVWLGASIEDGRVLHRLDRRAPAAIRFVSLEPLIGSVTEGDLTGIHWAIVGGESGPRARDMKPEWVDEIEACVVPLERPSSSSSGVEKTRRPPGAC